MAAAAYRFWIGPWTVSRGADPFGPPMRPAVEFDDVLDVADELGCDLIVLWPAREGTAGPRGRARRGRACDPRH